MNEDALARLAAWQAEHPNYLVETSSILYADGIGGGGFYHATISILKEHILTRTSRSSLADAIHQALDEYARRHARTEAMVA